MNVAGTSLIGQDLGKWQTQAAYQKGNILMVLGVLGMAIFALPVYFFAPEVIALFDPSGHPKIMEGGISYFRITLISLVFSAVAIIHTGTLRGAGDTKPAMYSAILNRNFVQLGVAYLLAFPLGMGYIGAWIGMIAGRFLDCIVMLYFWTRKKWLQVALENTDLFRVHLQYLAPANLDRYLQEVRTPLMAIKGTVEKVNPQQVIYQQPDTAKIIAFTQGDYRQIYPSSKGS